MILQWSKWITSIGLTLKLVVVLFKSFLSEVCSSSREELKIGFLKNTISQFTSHLTNQFDLSSMFIVIKYTSADADLLMMS